MGAVGMLLRRWRADRGLLLVLVLVVASTAGLVGAVPRLLDRLALSSLDAALDDTAVDRTGLAATSVQSFSVADPAAAHTRLDRFAAGLDADLDPALAAALEPPTPVVDSLRYDLAGLPGSPPDALDRKLTIRLRSGIEEHLTLREGSLPDGVPGTVALDMGEVGPDGEPVLSEFPVHEFAATAATAEALGLAVGDRRLGLPDTTGPILSRIAVPQAPRVVLELSGIVQLSPIDDPVWFGDPRLHRVSRFDTNNSSTLFGTGLVTAEGAGEFPGATAQPASIGVQWRLDRQGLLGGDLDAVRQAAVALRAAAPLELEEPRYSTGLDRVLATEAARRATAVEVLGLAAVSVLGIALALLVAVTAVLSLRRRDALALVRGRGASRAQLVATATAELGLVVAAGALVAQLVLLVVLPGADGADWVVPAIGGLVLLVLVVGGVRDARRRLGELLAERRRAPPPRPTHYVLDGLLVLVAGIAVASLRRRGIEVDGTIEPLVIAAPVLVAAAAAVLTARLAPLPLRVAEAAARRTRSMAVPLGLARAARASGGGVVVVLLVLGLGVAGLAASVHRSLVAGQQRAAQEQVGADVRIDAPALASLTPGWTAPAPGDASAELELVTRASAVTESGAQRVDVLLVAPEELEAVGLGAGLPSLAWDGVGPTPLLVSRDLRLVGSPGAGDSLTVLLGGQDRVVGEVAAIEPRVLGRDDVGDGAFIVLDRDAARAATGVEAGVTSRLVRTEDPDAVAEAALEADPDAEVLVRERIERALRDAPLSSGVRVGYLVAALVAVTATAVALVMALAAAAPPRRRQAAVLAALGTSSGRVRLALLVEVVPVVTGAAAVGVALAAAVSALLEGQLDLSPFTGTADQTGLVLPHWPVALLLVVGAAVVAAVGAVVTLGRVDAGALLREGDG